MKTVLIIDDSRDYADNLKHVLSFAGFGVAVAFDGRQGLDQALRVCPDLILLDLMMPDPDGAETAVNIRAQAALKDVSIIFLTAITGDIESKFVVQGEEYLAISKMADHQYIVGKVREYTQS